MSITAFLFEDKEIKTFTDKKKSPWFCAKDVCNTLDITWHGKITLAPIRQEWQQALSNDVLSKSLHKTIYINEAGLYKFVSKSNKKAAEEFMDWVYETVLPAIRGTGRYSINNTTVDPDYLKARLAMYEQKRKHITSIRDSPRGLHESLIVDVHELCKMLGQEEPKLIATNQIENNTRRLS